MTACFERKRGTCLGICLLSSESVGIGAVRYMTMEPSIGHGRNDLDPTLIEAIPLLFPCHSHSCSLLLQKDSGERLRGCCNSWNCWVSYLLVDPSQICVGFLSALELSR